LDAACAVDTTNVPSLQQRSVQACRAAFLRFCLRIVFSPSDSLQVLLATVLLVFLESGGMSVKQQGSGPTSNDLLESRIAENSLAALTGTGPLRGPLTPSSAHEPDQGTLTATPEQRKPPPISKSTER
jgi:hypothetical protein